MGPKTTVTIVMMLEVLLCCEMLASSFKNHRSTLYGALLDVTKGNINSLCSLRSVSFTRELFRRKNDLDK